MIAQRLRICESSAQRAGILGVVEILTHALQGGSGIREAFGSVAVQSGEIVA